MSGSGPLGRHAGQVRQWISELGETIARAFAEFLAIPSYIILGFLALAMGSYLLDRSNPAWLAPVKDMLRAHVFADPAATSSLLSTVAGGLITVTSITISLLLLALQQSAATMTAEILDQFLRRRVNQAYFGFFIGLALYSLVTLATVARPFNPIFGATLAFLLTVIALYLLLVLLYTTIDQMRPVQITEAIHGHVLKARERQLGFIRKTRRCSFCDEPAAILVRTDKKGFVIGIDVDAIAGMARKLPGKTEVGLAVAIGSYVAFQDVIAVAKAQTHDDATVLAKAVEAAVVLERQRDITVDPAYGVEQLAMIGWTSISTAKSNPAAGLLAVRALRDILARWSVENNDQQDSLPLPIVYADDVFEKLMDAFESLAVVSSESMQHQTFAEVVRTFAVMYPRLPAEQQPRAEDLLLRILSALGEHVLTRDLDSALSFLLQTLTGCGRSETAALVKQAQERLGESVGKLNSRSTRVRSS